MRYSSELARKTIHLSSLSIPLLLFWLPQETGRQIILIAALVMLAIDVVRLQVARVRTVFYFLFGRILREHERFNLLGSTYVLLAALICDYAFVKPVAVTSLGFLVVGDTMAALVGRRWGRIRILDKSLEGTLACLVSCLAIGYLYPGDDLRPLAIWAGAITATLFELLPIPLDDNMRIPLAAGFAMTLIV